jgi:hypothetical protein
MGRGKLVESAEVNKVRVSVSQRIGELGMSWPIKVLVPMDEIVRRAMQELAKSFPA